MSAILRLTNGLEVRPSASVQVAKMLSGYSGLRSVSTGSALLALATAWTPLPSSYPDIPTWYCLAPGTGLMDTLTRVPW